MNFKSFGGAMSIPLEEGFTVVTGPNGSGKSNILDGVLFCLGLSTSKGMRADRLPDLVNSSLLKAGKSAETIVSVKFDLTDWTPDSAEDGLEPPEEGPWIKTGQKEWIVTRKLRVMPGGSYSSTYAADGEQCNLQQLQTQLRRLRIDPEGSNVVMQGDVTRIVSMSNKDRRGLIDELAGVALFDNRIDQTRSKLDDVQERQDRCRIVEQELISSKQRLERDCAKARTYQELRDQLQVMKKQEIIMCYESAKNGLSNLKNKQQKLIEKEIADSAKLLKLEKSLEDSIERLHCLQENVKALGEDKLLAVQADLAGLDTQSRELDRQNSQHKLEGEKLKNDRELLIHRRSEINQELRIKSEGKESKLLASAENDCKQAEAAVEVSRRRLGEVAGRSGAWIEEQRQTTLSRQELQKKINPLKEQQQQLEERLVQIEERRKELIIDRSKDFEKDKEVNDHLNSLDLDLTNILQEISKQQSKVKDLVDLISIQQRTRHRLEQEQTRLEKDIARLESRREALQESRGTGALRLILEAGLEGIHGPVAHLAEVKSSHRLALEVAAGNRLAQIVVDNDQIAAKAIELLKSKRAGRLTFLPLNRLRNTAKLGNQAFLKGPNQSLQGLIGRAVDLIAFDPLYRDVFSYVFGETLVFKDLNSARVQLSKNRAVTLEGELLEKSGAMTGGTFAGKGLRLTFGRNHENDELEPIRNRLLEIGEALIKCRAEEAAHTKSLEHARPYLRKLENRQAALDAEKAASSLANNPLIERRQELSNRLANLETTKNEYTSRLNQIGKEIRPLIDELGDKEKFLQKDSETKNLLQFQADLEVSDEALIKARKNRDSLLNEQRQRQLLLERLEDQKNSLALEEQRLQESINSLAKSHSQWKEQNQHLVERRQLLENKQKELQDRFGEERRNRDAQEASVSNQRQFLQESQWKYERLKEGLTAIAEEMRSETNRINEIKKTLPDPLPEIPNEIREAGLDEMQLSLKRLQERIEALEPVNMLALEELEQIETRLADLVKRLDVLSEERSELLLRIETVATLRQEAFMEAFDAVDGHFREIFASLSDGDGHLQLDNSEDPLEGGLTLVAHPKGKTVRRLAAMSGGEKSLTALSFLFALQRFRPSPFYALDEVDSFLDGVNVERLSTLISKQAEEAQFLVVSHRRPMIASSSRTIGVTQARGSHTQVIGLPNAA